MARNFVVSKDVRKCFTMHFGASHRYDYCAGRSTGERVGGLILKLVMKWRTLRVNELCPEQCWTSSTVAHARSRHSQRSVGMSGKRERGNFSIICFTLPKLPLNPRGLLSGVIGRDKTLSSEAHLHPFLIVGSVRVLTKLSDL